MERQIEYIFNKDKNDLYGIRKEVFKLEIYNNKDKITKEVILSLNKLVIDIIKAKLYRTNTYEYVINIFGQFINACIIYMNKFNDDMETFNIIKPTLTSIFLFKSILFGSDNFETTYLINNNYTHPLLRFYIEECDCEFNIEAFEQFSNEFIDNLLITYYDKLDFTEFGYKLINKRNLPKFIEKFFKDYYDKIDDTSKIIMWSNVILRKDMNKFIGLCSEVTEISSIKEKIINCLMDNDDIKEFDYLCNHYDKEISIQHLEMICKIINTRSSYDISTNICLEFLTYVLEHKVIPNKNCFDLIIKSHHTDKIIKKMIELIIFHGYTLTYEDILLLASKEIDLGNYEDFKDYDDGRLYNICVCKQFHPSYFDRLKSNNETFHELFKRRLLLGTIRDSLKKGMRLDVKCLQNACAIHDNITVLKFLLSKGLVADEVCLKNLISATRDKSVKLILDSFVTRKDVKDIKDIKDNLELISLPKDFNELKLISIPKNFLSFVGHSGIKVFSNKKYSFKTIKKKILCMLRNYKIISMDSMQINVDNFVLNGYIKLSNSCNVIPIESMDSLIYTMIEYNKLNEHKNIDIEIELLDVPDNELHRSRLVKKEFMKFNKDKFEHDNKYGYFYFWEIIEIIYEYMKKNIMIDENNFIITGEIRKILDCKDGIRIPRYMLNKLVYTMYNKVQAHD